MSSSLVLPRPGTRPAPVADASTTGRLPRELTPPPLRPAVPAAAPAPARPEPEAAVEPASAEPTAARRLRQPPGRRAHLWLAALILGALVAGVPAVFSSGSTDITATAADYGLGEAGDISYSGGLDDAATRASITEAEAQARLGELAASRAAREPKTVLPTQGRLTTCFCMRWGTMHWGIDLAAPLGTPIYAATDGVVLRAGPASGYGNAIYIQNADGDVEIYGHMKYYSVRAGDVVHAGDQIAKVGSQGQSTGPHLHFELHRGGMTGKPFDPQEWLAERGITVG